MKMKVFSSIFLSISSIFSFTGPPEQAPKEKDNKFYEILGVEPNASTDEIRKNYKKRALKMHPDKGGDPDKVLHYFFQKTLILKNWQIFKKVQRINTSL